MTENPASEKKKVSLQELMKQKLENKKNQNAAEENGKANGSHSTHKMKSQQTKKASNTRRKMGS